MTAPAPQAKNTFRAFDTKKPSLHVLSAALLDAHGTETDSGLTTPTNDSLSSFQGLEVPYSRRIQRQACRRWADFNDDSSSCASSFITPSTQDTSAIPLFPLDSSNDCIDRNESEHYEDEEEEDSTTSSPTASFVTDVPLKGDADGAEAFAEDSVEEGEGLSTEDVSSNEDVHPHQGGESTSVPEEHRAFSQDVERDQQQLPLHHRHNPYCHTQAYHPPTYQHQYQHYPHQPYGAHSGLGYFAPPPPPAHTYAQHYEEQHPGSWQGQTQAQRIPCQDVPPYSRLETASEEQLPNANFELEGYVSFIPYEKMVYCELPNAAAVGAGMVANPKKSAKFFCGHIWGKLSSASLQWLVNKVVPSDGNEQKHRLFAPQLHFNKDGWFRGCLHVSVHSPNPQAIIDGLHKRVLYDHNGVWYAEDGEQQRILAEYCRKLRNLPQAVRHTKLMGLPCNPVAVEFANQD